LSRKQLEDKDSECTQIGTQGSHQLTLAHVAASICVHGNIEKKINGLLLNKTNAVLFVSEFGCL
jgi:hypothetical protein